MKTPRHIWKLAATLTLALAGSLAPTASAQDAKTGPLPVATGPFQGTFDSLQQYRCPEWFRDAKFGIWAHWGPQSVPMEGDWYARRMYIQGDADYKDHLARYGHPSEFGYKDIIPLWKAEKWDPDRLMALYKKAGAKYFVSMGCHHDNFDLWNSKFHRWNAVNMGPKRDVVGEWQKAAKKYGLRFGVSEHMGASFTWFQVAHGSDKIGPKAGVPYDGADPKYWDLYHQPAAPGDTAWYSNNPEWQKEWYSRVTDLIANYHLDLLYTDGGVPFGNDVGRDMIADLYNTNLKDHPGNLQVVYCCKQTSGGRWVEDLERGVMPKINPDPWQTDTSIADWFYNRHWKYRKADWVVRSLVDIVSKNGNLLLNVVQRPDGSLDPEVEVMLGQVGDWMKVNGQAIYGTRPWLVYGEGPAKVKGGAFKEDFGFSAKDIRFTTKGETLYAFALGWPEGGKMCVRSLAQPAGHITGVKLLGYRGKVRWEQTPEALVVTLPEKPVSDLACTLKITGRDLKPAPLPEAAAEVIQPDAKGNVTLSADAADLHGGQINTETRDGQSNIGFWDNSGEWAAWKVRFTQPGTFKVSATVATTNPESHFVLAAGGRQLAGKVEQTGDWGKFRDFDLGQIEIKQAGDQTITMKPEDAATWKAINLRKLTLTRAE
jgi:alpha-L-fucosidase